MAPIPDDNQNNPSDKDPNRADTEELETPNHIVLPAADSSSEDDCFDSDAEGAANGGYTLLPQDPDEEGESGNGDSSNRPQAFPPPSALDAELYSEPMTEMRGVGVDLTEAIAEGSVHPGFVANFPDNKVPVHLQMPDLPKKEDVLWNQSAAGSRLQLDSTHLSKVKSAMAGFKIPTENIPHWVQQIPEDQWKQQLVDRLAAPSTSKVDKSRSATKAKKSTAVADTAESSDKRLTSASTSSESSEKSADSGDVWPGT